MHPGGHLRPMLINMFISHGMYLSCGIFRVLSRACYGYIQCGFIPNIVWRFFNDFSSSFKGKKLAAISSTPFILGVDIDAIFVSFARHMEGSWYSGMSSCFFMAIHLAVHLYIYWVCSYRSTPICLSLEHLRGHLCVRHLCVCQYSHVPISPVVVCLLLWNCGYLVGCSFHCSLSCLYNEHAQYQVTIFNVDIIFIYIGSYHSCFSL